MPNLSSDPVRQRFAEIVLPHLDDALTLARWLTGNRSDAEDVTQDACIKAMSALDGFRGGSARAWTLSIVRSTAYTWLKRNRPQSLVLTDEPGKAEAVPGLVEAQVTPEAALIAAQTRAQVQAAIAGLDVPFREIIVLRDINGMSYREMGEILGVPQGTVMSRLARARGALMSALKENIR